MCGLDYLIIQRHGDTRFFVIIFILLIAQAVKTEKMRGFCIYFSHFLIEEKLENGVMFSSQ
jgi:hypothetical protein